MPPTTLDFDERETMYSQRDYDKWFHAGYYAPEFDSRVNQELDRLASLPPNWDREGAPRIAPSIIEAARAFISCLPEDIATIPAVVPSAAGNLQFEWTAGRRSLELEIETPATIHYLKWDPEEGMEEEDVFDIRDTDRAEFLIQWFMRGVADV
jgi:hypothetical protein